MGVRYGALSHLRCSCNTQLLNRHNEIKISVQQAAGVGGVLALGRRHQDVCVDFGMLTKMGTFSSRHTRFNFRGETGFKICTLRAGYMLEGDGLQHDVGWKH